MNKQNQAAAVAAQFQIEGEFSSVAPYGSGHINDTWCAVFHQACVPVRYILQRINTEIFKDASALMQNIQRVTAHLAGKLSGEPDSARRVLTLIPASDGRVWLEDAEGGFWRAYRFIEDARTYDAVQSPRQAFQAAKAFGQFQSLLVDLPAPPLHETIAGFHNTPRRFAAFEEAVAKDAVGRTVLAKPEIDFALARRSVAGVLLDAKLPKRVTHNDTKFNNVLLDDVTGEGLCVIDLDTVMPGLSLYDFGDMVRTTTSPAMEDEQDLTRITMQFPMFEALVRGYLTSAGHFLTETEKLHLAVAGKLIAFEQGIRFLADYLAGDTYYKIHRDGHNLDRCRTQFKLIESIEQQEETMNRLISGLLDGSRA
ncbi:MAG TPA: aminoglycoside phosphotransferase family protein [Terracidiphilus sp.]|jgi:aminoglycoside phosphotransferase (APT) family kinase protein